MSDQRAATGRELAREAARVSVGQTIRLQLHRAATRRLIGADGGGAYDGDPAAWDRINARAAADLVVYPVGAVGLA